MKKSLLLLLLSLLAYSGFSQDTLAVADKDKSYAIVSRLTRELNLTKNQQDQVYTSLQKRWKSVSKSKADKQPIDRVALNQKTVADLNRILSKDQFDLFSKLREEKKKNDESFRIQNPNYALSEEDKDMDL